MKRNSESPRLTSTQIKVLKRELVNWIDFPKWENPIAITLTHKRALQAGISIHFGEVEDYHKNLRYVLNVLRRKVFKLSECKRGRRLKTFAVLEPDQQGRLHYHLMISRPETVPYEQFAMLLEHVWHSSDWGYERTDIQPATSDGWIRYMSKFEFRNDVTNIDWANTFLN